MLALAPLYYRGKSSLNNITHVITEHIILESRPHTQQTNRKSTHHIKMVRGGGELTRLSTIHTMRSGNYASPSVRMKARTAVSFQKQEHFQSF